MRAAVLDAPGRVVVRDVPVPAADGLALVRVAQAGLCGTDLKIVSGQTPVRTPRILGHEMTGWVETPGPSGAVPEGTPVLVDPVLSCGRCDLCDRDLPHLCRDGGLAGREADGGLAEFVAADEARLHPLPADLPGAEAALLQVLSTCVHAQSGLPALEGAEKVGGRSAAVIGLGVTGLLHVQLLRARGAGTIIGITRSRQNRELALRLGATEAVSPETAEQAVLDATNGRGVDLAVECVGTPETLAQAMRVAGAGGIVLAFGITAQAADALPTYEWYFKELTILSPRAARPRDCDLAISLAASGQLDLAPLVTARFPLARLADALRACGEPGQLKVVVDVTGR
ncbi:MAG TPA: alcohol dehydrogenase catalytic domain-containing protein [Streptosporangiaceae bacterium]